MTIATPLDPTAFTDPESYMELSVAKQFHRLSPPTRGETRLFQAICLTDAVPLSGEAYNLWLNSQDPGDTSIGAPSISRFLVKAMIIEDEKGDRLSAAENPHAKLDSPCIYTTTENAWKAISRIMMYTTFISGTDFTLYDGVTLVKNDKILVSLVVDQYGQLMLDRGEIIDLVNRGTGEYGKQTNPCASLIGVFDVATSTGDYRKGGGAYSLKCELSGDKSTWRTSEDIQSAYGITKAEADETVRIAHGLNIDPAWFANAIQFESGWDPKAQNWNPVKKTGTRATGLIQWMPDTARSYGTTVEKIYDMTRLEQLKLAEKYFKGFKGKGDPADVLMHIFYPVAKGKPASFDMAAHFASRKQGKPFRKGGPPKDYDWWYDLFVKQNNGIKTKADYYNESMSHAKIKPPC